MKKATKLLSLATVIGLSLSTPAMADTGSDWYVGGGIGLTVTTDSDYSDSTSSGSFELDRAANLSLAVGKKFKENFRGEVELSYRTADLDSVAISGVGTASLDGDIETTTLLVNGYYDFETEVNLKPYLSAGIGFARHDAEDSVLGSGDDTVFAYQAGFGASYTLSDKTDLYTGYRYLGSSDPEFSGLEAEYDAHELNVGVRYSF